MATTQDADFVLQPNIEGFVVAKCPELEKFNLMADYGAEKPKYTTLEIPKAGCCRKAKDTMRLYEALRDFEESYRNFE